eukprot:scaffold2269_cov221-Pinguiococcus_pyrenoidosus.AAC.6
MLLPPPCARGFQLGDFAALASPVPVALPVACSRWSRTRRTPAGLASERFSCCLAQRETRDPWPPRS